MDKISNFFKMAYDDYCKYLETTKKTILEEINKSPKLIIDDIEFGELDRIFKPVSVKEYIKYCANSFHKISKHPKNKSVVIDLTVNEGFFMFAKNQEVTDEHWKLVKSINSSIVFISLILSYPYKLITLFINRHPFAQLFVSRLHPICEFVSSSFFALK